MKILSVVAMAAVAGFGGQTAQANENERKLTVYITNEHFAMPASNFAKDQAAKMFAKIGVIVEWRSAGRGHLPLDAIVVDIVEEQTSECGGALACALPYEGVHIRVFYNRFPATVAQNAIPGLLAHVLVHEITHILQGTVRHSESGVMKAKWSGQDFIQMEHKPLQFTEHDVILIKGGMEQRAARLEARRLMATNFGTAR